ncbi:MAG TPA: prolyl oligopeptidase family serine peptidase [Gammaproteobacteria bacterium]|nr:prolyl oligopeptidase family serine peptidase [Gammaproteobacteria bacterium]
MRQALVPLPALLAGLLSTALARAEIAVEDLARLPAMSSVSMASDGSYLVALLESDGELVLTVWDPESDEPPIGTRPNDRMKFIAAQALKADRLFVIGRQEFIGALDGCGEGNTTGATRTFVIKLYMTDTELQEFDEPFTRAGRALGVSEQTERCFELAGEAGLAGDLPLDPENVIAQRTDTLRLTSEYYLVNLRTNSERMIYRETEGESAGEFDLRTAELLTKNQIAQADGGNYEFLTLLRNAEGEFEVHEELTYTAFDRHTVEIHGRDEATGKYYVLTDLFRDHAGIYFYDAEAHAFDPEPLFATEQYDATGIVLGTKPSDFNQLIAFTYAAATEEYYIVDPEWDAIYRGLRTAYPDRHVRILEYTDDKTRILFSTSSSIHPPAYYLLEDRARTVLVGEERPWVDSGDLRPTELVYYTARDGMRIPAFLTLPKDWTRDDGALPSVVLPHGGPWSRDEADWDPSGWPQFLASRGYAVLQPQYRGSTGWGRDLWLAGDAEWGLKMQDDNDDAAAWLVEAGYADEDAIAIFGYSYGGFAAMAAVVRQGGPFECAIAGAGVANLARLGLRWSQDRVERAVQGRTVAGMDPLDNAEQADIPVLIYSGDRDVRVPIFHSESFYDAVRDRVDAELLIVPDMPHSLPWYPEHHRQTLTAIEEFLADDCGMPGAR